MVMVYQKPKKAWQFMTKSEPKPHFRNKKYCPECFVDRETLAEMFLSENWDNKSLAHHIRENCTKCKEEVNVKINT
jgi:hypothetical protein